MLLPGVSVTVKAFVDGGDVIVVRTVRPLEHEVVLTSDPHLARLQARLAQHVQDARHGRRERLQALADLTLPRLAHQLAALRDQAAPPAAASLTHIHQD